MGDNNSQHLDMIYSHSGTMYEIIPHVSRLSMDPRKPNQGPHANGVVGFVSHASMGQLVDQMGHMSISSNLSAIVTDA